MCFDVVLALLLPLVGTTLGSAAVFFLQKGIGEKWRRFFLGFAAGVMIAALMWSLLMPAIHSFAENDPRLWIVPALGVACGVAFLLLLDLIAPENAGERGGKFSKMMFAVTLHNIPEGLAVGVIAAGAIEGAVAPAAALALSLGIAIQNFPEGAIISMPLYEEGKGRKMAFFDGFLSGVVEPMAALLAVALTHFVTAILPFTLSFAAGAMLAVAVGELIPEACEGKDARLATAGLAFGFILMMVLDIL